MSDPSIPLSMLTEFHRKVVIPDIERIVGGAVGGAEGRLRDEMHALHDSLLVKLERLETEYEAIKAGLGRVEQRLDSLEAEHRDLAAQVRRLDERLSRVEKSLDELIASLHGHALQSEVQTLRARLDVVEAQVAALRKTSP